MPKKPVSPEVSAYLAKIGRRGGKKGAKTTNELLTEAQRKANASKAGIKSSGNMSKRALKKRAQEAAAARWDAAKKEPQ